MIFEFFVQFPTRKISNYLPKYSALAHRNRIFILIPSVAVYFFSTIFLVFFEFVLEPRSCRNIMYIFITLLSE